MLLYPHRLIFTPELADELISSTGQCLLLTELQGPKPTVSQRNYIYILYILQIFNRQVSFIYFSYSICSCFTCLSLPKCSLPVQTPLPNEDLGKNGSVKMLTHSLCPLQLQSCEVGGVILGHLGFWKLKSDSCFKQT